MKKFFKSKRRWIAFSLALVLIVSTCISSSDAFLWAFGGVDEAAEEVSEESAPAEATEIIHVVESDSTDSTETTEAGPGDTTDAADTEADPADTPDDGQGTVTDAGEAGPEGTDADVEQPDAEEQVPAEDAEVVEDEVTYGYTIYYYYDDVEDEDARVEDAGALGDPILTYAEGETVHDGKDYVLDRIENKDGVISEDAGKNVVGVYYVLKGVEEIVKPQTLSVEASDGAKITVEAPEGALPEGAKVTAKVVTITSEMKEAVEDASGEKEVKILKAYDVTITDADGKEIQPDESVKVTIQNAKVRGENLSVYHMSEEGTEEVAGNADGNQTSFEVEHFSMFLYVERKPVAMELTKQKVYVYLRVKGELEGIDKNWNEWYTLGYVEADLPEINDHQYTAEQEEAVRNIIKAKSFKEYCTRDLIDNDIFEDIVWSGTQGGDQMGLQTASGAAKVGEEVYEPYGVLTWHFNGYAAGQYIIKYRDADNTDIEIAPDKTVKDQNFSATIDADQIGGDNKPEIITYNGTEYGYDSASDPIKIGINGSENVITLYYRLRTADYSVEYYQQNVDGTYSKIDGITKTGDIGALGTADINPPEGFKVNGFKSEESGIITADGSLVLKVYYDRNPQQYTVKYLEKDTEKELAEEIVITEGVVFGNVITEDTVGVKKDIIGYTFVETAPERLVIGTNNAENVITVYYKAKEVGYTVTYHYSDKTGEIIAEETDTGNKGSYGTDIPYEKKDVQEYKNNKYIPDTRYGSDELVGVVLGKSNGKISENEQDNRVEVYYALDSNDNEVPDYLEHNVSYNLRGGKDEEKFIDNNLYPENSDVTIIADTPVKKGTENQVIEFAGWKSDDVELEGEATTFKMPDKDVILNAQWKSLSVLKNVTSGSSKSYKLGEEITFDIIVENTGDVDLTNVTVRDELPGVEIRKVVKVDGKTETEFSAEITNGEESASAQIETLVSGESVVVKAYYVVREQDLVDNNFTNTAVAESGNVKDEKTTDKIPMAEVDKQLTVTKTIKKNADGSPYGATGKDADGNIAFTTGNTVTFEVTVTNTGNQTLNNINITDEMQDAVVEESNAIVNFFSRIFTKVVRSNGDATITSLKPSEKKTVEVTYQIKESDLGKTLVNVAMATAEDGTTNTGTTEEPIPLEDERVAFDLKKAVSGEATGADGKYKEGDKLTYTITVKNTGNTALEQFEVTDHMTVSGDSITDRIVNPKVVITDKENKEVENVNAVLTWENGKFTVSEIPFDRNAVISYIYEVTADDAGKTINNTAIAGTGDDKKEETPENPVVVEKRELKTEKVIADIDGKEFDSNAKYTVGNVINFTVKVTNTGNVDLSDIVVTDTMTGNREATLREGESSTIASLAAGASTELHYSYTVAEGDLGAEISNKAWAKSGDTKSDESETSKIKIETASPLANISKTITSTGSAERGKYKVGEKIQYQIVIENKGNTVLRDVKVTDSMTGASGKISNIKLNGKEASAVWDESKKAYIFTIATIARDSQAVITYEYEVQPEDQADEKIDNSAEVNVRTNTSSNPPAADIERRSLDVKKAVLGSPADRESYQLGEEITFVVTVRNDGNVSLSDIIVTDEMKNAAGKAEYNAELTAENNNNMSSVGITEENGNVKLGKLNTNEMVYLYYTYEVEADDIGNTNTLYNKVTVDAKDGPETETEVGPLPIAGRKPSYELRKTVEGTASLENGTIYAVGDTVKYTIEVENTGNVELKDLTIEDVMEGASGSIKNIDGAEWDPEEKTFTIDSIGIGSTAVITYEYQIQKGDIGKEITNTATLEGQEVTPVNPVVVENRSLKVEKVVDDMPANGSSYALGEEITFKVTVTNTGNVALNDISVYDKMFRRPIGSNIMENAAMEAETEDDVEFDLAAGESKELVYIYTVQEEDLGSSVINRATAEALNGPIASDEADAGVTDVKDPKLSIVKTIVKTITSTPNADTGMYKVGDTITYQIVVENEGNTTLKDVEVKDTMTGASGKITATSVEGARYKGSSAVENGMEYTFEISEIPVGGTGTITYSYRVVKDDIGKSIRNAAVAEGVENEEDSKNPEPVVIENRKLEVTKRVVNEPADGEAYKLGETIQFEIIVKNAGNVDLTDIKLTDIMVGAAGNATVGTGLNTLDIGILRAGETYSTTNFRYTVKEADLKAPSDDDAIKNTVTAIASDGTEGYGETEYLKVGEQRPDFTVAKAIIGSGSAEGGRYAAGEAIHYQITVTNTGNTTLRNIVVKDKMTGATGEISAISANATWRKEMGSFIINEPIPVGGEAVIAYDYVVQPEDAGNRIRNVATGKPWSDVVTEAEVEKKELTVNKYIANSPANGTAYTMGEEILFGVTVTNTGNVSLSDITVTDQMNAAGQAVPVAVNEDGEVEVLNSNHTIDSLTAGQSVTVYYSYTVQEDDIGRTDISNVVTADGSGTKGTDEIPVENIDRLYTLTIHYVYSADGTTAAADYTVQLPAGKDYVVYSPVIEGYNSSAPFITGTMPERDLEFNVYYAAPTTPGGGGGGGTPDTPEPPTPPTPPTEPEPVVPIIPGPVPAGVVPVVVPADPALAAIGDEAVPLQGALIDVDDDGNVTITPIEEEEVPLAGGTVDEHTCCILHFLLMLAAMIVYSCYTSSMKKRQKKLAELKDQLANETLKRQLGVTDDKQAKM